MNRRLFASVVLSLLVLAMPIFASAVQVNSTFTFTSATDVPVEAASYTAAGEVNFTLGYVPVTGTTLTVVKNTGLGFISGQFGNLTQGQEVDLTFAGISYTFVANYYGGTGNDLVLHWAGTKAMAWGEQFQRPVG